MWAAIQDLDSASTLRLRNLCILYLPCKFAGITWFFYFHYQNLIRLIFLLIRSKCLRTLQILLFESTAKNSVVRFWSITIECVRFSNLNLIKSLSVSHWILILFIDQAEKMHLSQSLKAVMDTLILVRRSTYRL